MGKGKHRVAFSGGKDSTAMLIRMLEKGMKIDIIEMAFAELEFEEVLDYVEKVNQYIKKKYNKEIEIHDCGKRFGNLFYKKKTRGKRKGEIRGFPLAITRGCWVESEIKVSEMDKRRSPDDIVYIGFNSDEKNRKLKNERIKYKVKYPLIKWGWSSVKCLEFLKKRGLFPPIYNKIDRTGCWFCPKQNMKSLFYLWKNHPQKWKQLKKWEKDSPDGFHPQYTLKEKEEKFKKWDAPAKTLKYA